MIDFFNNNQHAFWLSAGFLILLVELGVFGLSSGVLLFTGRLPGTDFLQLNSKLPITLISLPTLTLSGRSANSWGVINPSALGSKR